MFKVGDRVKCVSVGASRVLEMGRMYTVSEVRDSGCIMVKEVQVWHAYYMDKFTKTASFKGNIK